MQQGTFKSLFKGCKCRECRYARRKGKTSFHHKKIRRLDKVNIEKGNYDLNQYSDGWVGC